MQAVGGHYQAASVKAEPGKPFVYRMIVGTIEDVARFREAFDASDDKVIGAADRAS